MVNHIGSIVKLLEVPKKDSSLTDLSSTRVRAQLPLRKATVLVELIFWGKLANDILGYYKPNDYLIIEGYIGLAGDKKFKKIEITVFRIYPITIASKADLKKPSILE